jgi:hypothetical protein
MPEWLRSLVLSSSRWKGMRHLVIHDCSGITDKLLERLSATSPLLVTVSIRAAPAVTGRGMRLPALQELMLEGCDVDDAAVAAITSACRALLALTLCGAARLRLLPIRSGSLLTLKLLQCAALEDAGIAAACAGCPALQALYVNECARLEQPSVRSAELRRLHLGECAQLTSATFSSSHWSTPSLTCLTIAHCRQPNLFLDHAGWPPSLLDVTLDRCTALSDEAVGRLGQVCSRLERLVVRSCPRIRAPALEGPCLTELDFGSCEQLSTQAIAAVLPRCPNLARLELAGCDLVHTAELSEDAQVRLLRMSQGK